MEHEVFITSLDDPRMALGEADYSTWGVAILKSSLRALLEREKKKDARIEELEYQNKQLEEYTLKGIAFRDELQAELAALRTENERLLAIRKVATDWAKELSETRELIARAEKAEAENERLREVVDILPGWIVCIKAERKRQDAKWGEQNHDDLYWLGILMEEVGELAKSVIENDSANGVKELIQSASVCVAWYEAINRRTALKKLEEE